MSASQYHCCTQTNNFQSLTSHRGAKHTVPWSQPPRVITLYLPSQYLSCVRSSTTQFQMNLANSILVVRFAQWLAETENLIDGYFCCTLVSGRLEEHFPPQIWCTPTTSPSILCAISPVYCLRSSLTVPLTSLDPVFSHQLTSPLFHEIWK